MNYVLKTKLPEEKSVLLAFMSIYGISRTKSSYLCRKLGFLSNFKVKNLSNYQWQKILRVVNLFVAEHAIELGPDLKSLIRQNEKNLIALNLYRGSRLKKGLPLRGQRTHSNAQTARRFATHKKQVEQKVKKQKKHVKKK